MKTFFKAVGIGALAGFFTLFVIFILFDIIVSGEYFDSFSLLLGGILSIPAMPFGIIGALIGWYWRKTGRATWIGGIIGGITTVLPVSIYFWQSGYIYALFGGY